MPQRIFICVVLLLCVSIAQAKNDVVYKLSAGIEGVARYMPGEKTKPAIFILHGFLTTNNFNTILSLGQMLHENGYTVLAPTLTLGINRRDSGLACKAIHTNTVEDDVNEIADWVNWLVKKGHKDIVLLGHSQGSLKQLVYAAERKNPKEVKLIISTSLSYIDAFIEESEKQQLITSARQAIKDKNNQPETYSVAYCKNDFIAPANVYLSLVRWDKELVISAIDKVNTPLYVIMGGKDRYFDKPWQTQMQNTKAKVSIIDNASHFFDGNEEFDYHDKILSILDDNLF